MMCAVGGMLLLSTFKADEKDVIGAESLTAARNRTLNHMMAKAEARGRDSWGVVSFSTSGTAAETKDVVRFSNLSIRPKFIQHSTCSVLFNTRAEPLTESVQDKTFNDIQPFEAKGWYVSHNGIVANDKKLSAIHHFGHSLSTKIDSAILPHLFKYYRSECVSSRQFGNRLVEVLRDQVVGSFALAAIDNNTPNEVWLAVNYKPLYIKYSRILNAVLFASDDSYFPCSTVERMDLDFADGAVDKIPPYQLVRIASSSLSEVGFTVCTWDLHKDVPEPRALVVCSGGMDSTVVAHMLKRQDQQFDLLHFTYGCKAQTSELRAVQDLAVSYGCKLYTMEIPLYKQVSDSSSILDSNQSINVGVDAAEFATEWVPARNLIFLSLATGLAEAKGYSIIAFGGNLEESGTHADNEAEFVKRFNEVLPNATNLNKHVELIAPLMNMMKTEIVKWGMVNGAPLRLSWSCYSQGPVPCGKCGSCYLRQKSFESAGYSDPALEALAT